MNSVARNLRDGGGARKALRPRSATAGALGAGIAIHDEIAFLDNPCGAKAISAISRS